MGFWDFLTGRSNRRPQGAEEIAPPRRASLGVLGVAELARRLGMGEEELRSIPMAYREYTIPKRGSGQRHICAPQGPLMQLQRRLLRRVLGRLVCHTGCMGFQKGRSMVHNSLPHVGKAVLVRMDIRDFFTSTLAPRVKDFFLDCGWDAAAADLLTRWCTHRNALPQGAPTSPRLSNLLNYRMDARLAGLAASLNASYTRYADDMTFSFAAEDRGCITGVIGSTKKIIAEYGYHLHQDRKLRISRRHECQMVTGLVVNERVALPRRTRRWLRAVRHHIDHGKDATLTPQQYDGWISLWQMVNRQAQGPQA